MATIDPGAVPEHGQVTLEEMRVASQGSVKPASAADEWVTFQGLEEGGAQEHEISIPRAWALSAVVTGIAGSGQCTVHLPGMRTFVVRGERNDVVRKLA